MAQLGEIRKNRVSQKFIWAACEICGQERWVLIVRNEAISKRCRKCGNISRERGKYETEGHTKKYGGTRIHRNSSEYNRVYAEQLKEEVLNYYGNGEAKCVICGESRLSCLSIDHTNGGGNKHRKEIGLGSGGHFYRWLKRNGYPLGFRTLCMNCQMVTQFERRQNLKNNK